MPCRQRFSKMLSTAPLYSTCTRALTFENVCHALQSKVSRIAHSSSKLRDDEALAQRASELEAVSSEHQVASLTAGVVGGGWRAGGW